MNLKKANNTDLHKLVLLGIIVALEIILNRFSFGPSYVKVGLGFIGSALLGYMFGPIWGGIGGGISDLISSAIFGNIGGYFIGFTISAFMAPFIYGMFFYQKPVKVWRIVVAVLTVTIIVNILMNTVWIHILYNLNFKAALSVRIVKELIVPWIQMIIIYFVLQGVSRVKMKQ